MSELKDMTEAPTLAQTEVVYLGRRAYKTGSFHLFALEDALISSPEQLAGQHIRDYAEGVDRKANAYKITKKPPATIGAIYTTNAVVEDSKIVRMDVTNFKFVRKGPSVWFDTGLVANWNSQDGEVEMEKKRASHEKFAAADVRLDQAVAVLRQRYRSITPTMRTSFQLWLLKELTK